MIFNYIKIAFRNIRKNKGYAFINIVGLALGLAVFSLITSFVEFHFSFDEFHKDADSIYSIVKVLPSGEGGERHTARTRTPLMQYLLNDFPEIEDATRLIPLDEYAVRHGAKKFYERSGTAWCVDPNFLSFFTFETIAGDPTTALSEPNSVVLTESVAQKYFGNGNPIGQTLSVKLYSKLNVVVKGITKDAPSNSSFKYGMLISLNTLTVNWDTNWQFGCTTFIQIDKQALSLKLEQRFPAFIKKNISNLEVRPKSLYLLPLSDIHHKSWPLIRGMWHAEPQTFLLMTLAVGTAILLVVCFNFMSLATAQYMARAGEVGMRKVVGGSRLLIICQFLGESVLIAFMAFPLAILFNETLQLPFNAIWEHEVLSMVGPGLLSSPMLLLKLFGVTILLGLVAGSYPAFYLSRLNPAQFLKGNLLTGRKGSIIRQLLVASQFTVSICLVIGAILTIQQQEYLLSLDLGYNRDQVIVARVGYGKFSPNLESFKNELKRHPNIVAVSSASYMPVNWGTEYRVTPEGKTENEGWNWNAYGVDYDYIELLEMEIVNGRSFSRDYDDKDSFIINQTAARQLGWKDPIGKQLSFRFRKGVIVGIVRDFHFTNLFQDIFPSVLFLRTDFLNFLHIKISDVPISEVIRAIEEKWRDFIPDLPFEYWTLDDAFSNRYTIVRKWGLMIGTIGAIGIFFSCLGLLGLASHAVRRRTKEIGIRKAHGAAVSSIIRLLLKGFFRLIVLANIIAWSLSYYLGKKIITWGWAYPMDLDIGVYIFAGVLSFLVTFLAVIFQTYKAATANPVEALRYE
jgi:putative ABC transport system permease protein